MWDRSWIVRLSLVGLVTLVVYASWQDARQPSARWYPLVGTPGAASTSREDLQRETQRWRSHLEAAAGEPGAAVALASALLRQARVQGNGTLAVEAEPALRVALDKDPTDYGARRMLAAVLLSEHRFRAAIEAAEGARRIAPRDAWNYGALGDAYLELGDYERAFDAYDQMIALRPGPEAYARMAHAYEIQGDLERALKTMQMAADATSAHDPEAQAWSYAQLGHLHFQLGRLAAAEREYRRAAFVFPGHPYAQAGLGRVCAARGEYSRALKTFERLVAEAPAPEWVASVGDLRCAIGDAGDAERMYQHAERLEREGWQVEQPQYGALARFLAERGRQPDEAVRLAERAARDRRVLYHAAAIRNAMGNAVEA